MSKYPVTGAISKDEALSVTGTSADIEKFFGKGLMTMKELRAACPECQGTGMVGDYGPGGIDRPDRRTGNSEAQPCDHSLANAQVCDPTKEDS